MDVLSGFRDWMLRFGYCRSFLYDILVCVIRLLWLGLKEHLSIRSNLNAILNRDY